MNRQDVAIVVNSCPKYFYLLEAFFGLIRRYAEDCKWPIFFGTDKPEDDLVLNVCKRHSVTIIPLTPKEEYFLESRAATVKKLPETIRYVLPLQEDFLLERKIDENGLSSALDIFDSDMSVQGIRLMPCPGSSNPQRFWGDWCKLSSEDLLFSYQATLWRRDIYERYMNCLIQQGRSEFPGISGADWNRYCISTNPAETSSGLYLLKSLYSNAVYLCWPRKASWANAVYWSPWPYRPTAVVKGILQPWAVELIRREGFYIQK